MSYSWSYDYENHNYLDLIHGVDVFIEKYGHPEFSNLVDRRVGNIKLSSIEMGYKDAIRKVLIITGMGMRTTINGRKVVLPTKYDLLVKQIKYWLTRIKGRKSINSINTAVERTKWLIGVKNVTNPLLGLEV